MTFLVETYAAGQRKACELVGVARSSFRYRSKKRDDELRTVLIDLAQEKPRYGYRRLAVLLRRQGDGESQAGVADLSGGGIERKAKAKKAISAQWNENNRAGDDDESAVGDRLCA